MENIQNFNNGTAFCIVPVSIDKQIIELTDKVNQMFEIVRTLKPNNDGLLNLQEAKQLIGVKADNTMKKLISEHKITAIRNGKEYKFDKQTLLNEYCNIK